jgi:hypothetical protein
LREQCQKRTLRSIPGEISTRMGSTKGRNAP